MTRIPIDDDPNDGPFPQDPGPMEDESDESAFDGQNAAPEVAPSQLQAERDALFDRLARATADFKNTQKRLQAEADQRVQYSNQSLIKSLLPVIDNFERALAVDIKKADVATLLKGMQIVHDQWLKVLKEQKVEEIAPAPGSPYDPLQHEALMQQESEYAEPTVMQLFQKGYSLHGRTLRPAQVAVSKTS